MFHDDDSMDSDDAADIGPCQECDSMRFRKTALGHFVCVDCGARSHAARLETQEDHGGANLVLGREVRWHTIKRPPTLVEQSRLAPATLALRLRKQVPQPSSTLCVQVAAQHILALQTRDMVRLLDLPPSYEGTVRQLWRAYLDKGGATLDGKGADVATFRLPRLLSIQYTALRLYGTGYTATDVVRWALEGSILFANAWAALPTRLTQQMLDREGLFTVIRLPTPLSIEASSRQLCEWLGQELPEPNHREELRRWLQCVPYEVAAPWEPPVSPSYSPSALWEAVLSAATQLASHKSMRLRLVNGVHMTVHVTAPVAWVVATVGLATPVSSTPRFPAHQTSAFPAELVAASVEVAAGGTVRSQPGFVAATEESGAKEAQQEEEEGHGKLQDGMAGRAGKHCPGVYRRLALHSLAHWLPGGHPGTAPLLPAVLGVAGPEETARWALFRVLDRTRSSGHDDVETAPTRPLASVAHELQQERTMGAMPSYHRLNQRDHLPHAWVPQVRELQEGLLQDALARRGDVLEPPGKRPRCVGKKRRGSEERPTDDGGESDDSFSSSSLTSPPLGPSSSSRAPLRRVPDCPLEPKWCGQSLHLLAAFAMAREAGASVEEALGICRVWCPSQQRANHDWETTLAWADQWVAAAAAWLWMDAKAVWRAVRTVTAHVSREQGVTLPRLRFLFPEKAASL